MNTKQLLVTEKVIGNVHISMGFVYDVNGYYVPNTALKENIKKLTFSQGKIIAILEKNAKEKQYRKISYINKNKEKEEIFDLLKKVNLDKNIF